MSVGLRMFGVTVCCALLFSACALRRTSPQSAAELGRAEALSEAGCYTCLQEALEIYERAASQSRAPAAAVEGAFRTAVLLTLRSRELGLPDAAALEVAQRWAAAAPTADKPPRLPAQRYLDALELVHGELSGHTPEERENKQRQRRAAWPNDDGELPEARRMLTPMQHLDVLAQYIAVAIDCEDARARKSVDYAAILARFPGPLMRFRIALCGIPSIRFEPIRQEDARWVDTLFFEGRSEMSRFPAPDVGRAAELFTAAHDAFPQSVAITLALGNARNALEEHQTALALFDSVLEPHPTHRDALLGRVLSLSYMRRHYDAIRSATTMIELGTYHLGDAYYWRAWNRYQVHELPSAWSDVEAATKLMVNTAVHTLAGFIAYAQRNLLTAIDRLDKAYRLDNSNCEAPWTEGLVHVDLEAWEQASARFTIAAGCFAADAKSARDAMTTAQESTWAEPIKIRRIATARKRAETSEHRHAQSAFNAASAYVRLGRKAEALGYLELAAQHPLLKDKAVALRATIEKLP